jgi:hypothetical protein
MRDRGHPASGIWRQGCRQDSRLGSRRYTGDAAGTAGWEAGATPVICEGGKPAYAGERQGWEAGATRVIALKLICPSGVETVESNEG